MCQMHKTVCWMAGVLVFSGSALAVSEDLRSLQRGTNATFVAPVPLPPDVFEAHVPEHNLTRPTVDYTNAVIMEGDEKIWLKQLHYYRNGDVVVHKNNFSEIWEDTENGWIAIRADTGPSGGGGVCLLLPLPAIDEPPQVIHPRFRRHASRRDSSTAATTYTSPMSEATLRQHASISLGSLRSPAVFNGAQPQETFVALSGPVAHSGDVTGQRIQQLCHRLDVYIVEKIPRQTHEHKERSKRRLFKAVMRAIGWVWTNRRVLGIPFGVRGPIYVKG